MMKFLSRIVLGDQNAKEIRRHERTLQAINDLADEMKALSDDELRAKTAEFRQQVANGAEIDDLLVPAFAVVREAAERAVGMRPFDVQIIGGIVLHEGDIAEMKTGEGKTLVAVLPAYLNALTGNGVHIVTVNDYLAKRDAEWMGKVYNFLGLSVGLIVHDLEAPARRAAYAADVTYGTNNEFGFDYLRDNMVISPEEMVHRGFHYAIVDEVDSILIDEARTPLIISGPGDESTDLYYRFAQVVRSLHEGDDYTVDEKAHTVAPTEAGVEKVEKLLGVENLYADAKTDLSHYLMQALKAKALMKLDKDYVVKDGEVLIVDEFTGRLMFGRRYSDGLHQAIEAKEGVKIESENQTLATITFQNYFRMYDKLSGMTGTAATEAEEFRKIYGLDVVVIPTHKPMIREDLPDLVYGTEEEKFDAVVQEIQELHEKERPVLVGTISIEKSERLSRMLEKKGIKHNVLNAKHHEQEAEIIANAGQPGSVTIATNMAGRGTDIVLGEGVAAKGGLHIIGTERHESRRIDNQLRGRSGRQGDPGSSRFYVSLEDDLMRIFGSDNMRSMLQRMGLNNGEPLEHPMLTRGIETAQKRVESRNFDMRKNVLEYDDVMNVQREIVYKERRAILLGEDDVREKVFNMVDVVIDQTAARFCPEGEHHDDWNLDGLLEFAETLFLDPDQVHREDLEDLNPEEIGNVFKEAAYKTFASKEEQLGPEVMADLTRFILLRVIDDKWVAHLGEMNDLREGIGLRAYGQTDPLVAYKREAFDMFQAMSESVQEDVVRFVLKSAVVVQPQFEPEERRMYENDPSENLTEGYGQVVPLPELGIAIVDDEEEEEAEQAMAGAHPYVREVPKVGRNDLCPCGSGKKYKRCHGAKEA